MKITKSTLKQLIKEELLDVLSEDIPVNRFGDDCKSHPKNRKEAYLLGKLALGGANVEPEDPKQYCVKKIKALSKCCPVRYRITFYNGMKVTIKM